MEKVSIVLPTYNGQDNLEKSIESIIRQTYINWELIIVDDCSTDLTKEIANDYAEKDKRIKVISNERNMKLPKSLNIGFQNAEGEYYTWTSDDNLYKENAIEIMVNFLKNEPDYDMVYCDTVLINGNGDIIRENPLPEPEKLILGNTVGACFLYRCQIAKKIGGYDEDLFLAEDYEYWLRMSQHAKIKHISEGLYFYRCHEKSLSSTRLADIKKQTAKVWEKHYDFIMKQIKGNTARFAFFDTYLEYVDINDKKRILNSIEKEYKKYKIHYWVKKWHLGAFFPFHSANAGTNE